MAQRHRRRPQLDPALADGGIGSDWVDFGDHRMFVVGYTAGGAPYGWVEYPAVPWSQSDDVAGLTGLEIEPF